MTGIYYACKISVGDCPPNQYAVCRAGAVGYDSPDAELVVAIRYAGDGLLTAAYGALLGVDGPVLSAADAERIGLTGVHTEVLAVMGAVSDGVYTVPLSTRLTSYYPGSILTVGEGTYTVNAYVCDGGESPSVYTTTARLPRLAVVVGVSLLGDNERMDIVAPCPLDYYYNNEWQTLPCEPGKRYAVLTLEARSAEGYRFTGPDGTTYVSVYKALSWDVGLVLGSATALMAQRTGCRYDFCSVEGCSGWAEA